MTSPVPPMYQLYDTLEFVHPQSFRSLDESFLMWGDVAPGSSADRYLRLRNTSYTYTAESVQLRITEIREVSFSVAAQHLLSLDGRKFTATLSIGSLSPRGISERIILRRITPPNAITGEGMFQVLAEASDWI